MAEFEEVITSTKGKTPGGDRISYPIIKNLPPTVESRLIRLYNLIFDKGIYPQNWKNADIVPILKQNKPPDQTSSYRPISLLSCLSKVLEKIIAKRIMWFALREKHISPNQVAFKTGQGTLDILLHFEHYLSTALSNRNHVTILGLDFEKAFDRIGAHVVLRQLKNFQVGKKIYSFVKSFLVNRTFRTKINNKYSDRVSLYNGIAQGSPISVVFFIIAFDEISQIIKKYNAEHSIYADDVLVFSKSNNFTTTQTIFSNILNEIYNWSNNSGANISYEKCHLFHVCRKQTCQNNYLTYRNHKIENVNCLKILGVIFDKTLNFKQHCKHLRKKLNTRLNIVKYLASKHSKVHPDTLINVTKTLILSVIDYGLPIYGQCAKSTIALLAAPYHAAIRRSLRAFPTTPINNLMAESGLPSIEERIMQSTFRLIHKCFITNNIILYKDMKNITKRTRKMRRPSTIYNVFQCTKKISISLNPILTKTAKNPTWLLPSSVFINQLFDYPKQNTNPLIYRKTFLESQTSWKINGWKFLYTDGSKSDLSTSFAVVTEEGRTIRSGLHSPTVQFLPPNVLPLT
uniref:RNA-directed DNA polymerase from mobile element jockey n=1 Tax=Ceratitis capitata TaxID=7213 RepID=W8BGW3_CERCA